MFKTILVILLSLTYPTLALDLDSKITVLEAQMSEISTRTPFDTVGAKTASASPQIHGEHWFFAGNMLWWHADIGGTDYADLFDQLPGIAPSARVDNRHLTFKWDYGFRAQLGKIFTHDNWDLLFSFTWYRSKNSSASSLHEGAALVPLLMTTPLLANQVKAHWNVHFYTLEMNLGRALFFTPRLSLHPFVGLKSAWITQHIKSQADAFYPYFSTFRSKARNDFWGLGPSFGCEGKWFLDYGLNLLGSLTAAMMWGDFTVRHKEASSSQLFSHENFDLHQIVPMTQTQIGLGYETNFYHNSYHLSVRVLYEMQYWWNQNQMPQLTSFVIQRFQRYSQDLSLQGVTVDVRFDF